MISKLKNILFAENPVNHSNILENPENKTGVFLNKFIIGLVLLFIIVLIFESLGNNGFLYKSQLLIIEAYISVVFAIEYFYRLWKAENKVHFVFSLGRIIDLLSFLPFFLGLFPFGELGKVLRVLRVLRVIRLLKRIPLTRGFIKAIGEYKDEYAAVCLLFGVILFIGSVGVYFSERSLDMTLFTSIPAALWWGLVTMTTVGYGDMHPVSDLGKFVGAFLVFLGPLTIGLFSAVTVMVFQEAAHNQNMLHNHTKKSICKRCRQSNPKEANYCMKCGEEFGR
ncbi:MAG: hypothetical protein GY828_08355 [Candidatus Gracilibacteria bacterium]|nr:hypothetical protein [Candidatus Gracilibacteria bacterium]